MHKPTRRSQPYRTGMQHPGHALDAMRQGQPMHLPNPIDLERRKQSMLALMAKGLMPR